MHTLSKTTTAPRRWRRSVPTLVVAAALVLAACGDDDDAVDTATTTLGDDTTTTTDRDGTTTTTDRDGTTTTAGGAALDQSCTQTDRDVRVTIRYPEGWHVNDGDAATACSAFDPESFELQRGTQYPSDLAAVVRVEPVSFERASNPDNARVEDRQTAQVDGRQAVRLRLVWTGEGLRPEGERAVQWVVDAGNERVIIAQTSQVEGNDFERSTQVLDQMVRSFDIEPRP